MRRYRMSSVGGVGGPEPLFVATLGTRGDDVIQGTADKDVLKGRAGDDALYGYDGNDVLVGGAGSDRLFGGDGIDTVSFKGTAAPVTLDLDPNGVSTAFVGGVAEDTIRGVERIVGGDGGDAFSIAEDSGRIAAGAGDDTIFIHGQLPRPRDFRIDGGAGAHDVLDLSRIDVGPGPVGHYGVYLDRVRGIEDVNGSAFDDDIVARTHDDASNTFHGGRGDDSEFSNPTQDAPDFLYGDEGNDRLELFTLFGEMHGGAGDDSLEFGVFSAGVNSFLIDGGAGDDSLGSFVGDTNIDHVTVVLANEGEDGSLTLSDGTSGVLRSVENVTMPWECTLVGNDGVNDLQGGADADTITGGGGDDVIQGNRPAAYGPEKATGDFTSDVLTGGTGADTFVVTNVTTVGGANATDRITDFSSAEHDRIDLTQVDADTSVAGVQSFAFIGRHAFTDTPGELRFEVVDGATFVSGDANGDGVAEFTLQLDGARTLTAADFVL